MRYVVFALGAFVTCGGALAYHQHYFRWRDCFNELGRCYDSQTHTVYLEQAGITWAGLTLLGLLISLAAVRAMVKASALKRKTPR